MTNPNLSHISLLCDRSGSMSSCRADAEGAVNTFLDQQAAEPGECTLLLADFDAPDTGQPDWFRVVHDGPIADRPKYDLHPRGWTCLFDAMGKMIELTGTRLAAMPENERPGHVFVVIQTDGGENRSKEWKLPFLIEKIKQQEQDYQWTFIFLGMGLDAFQASQMFVGTQMVGNATRSANTGKAYGSTYSFMSANVAKARAGGQSVDYGAEVDEEGNVKPLV